MNSHQLPQLNYLGGGGSLSGITYTNSSGGFSSLLINSLPWTLEQNVTATSRPLIIQVIGESFILKNAGSVTGNIYINGIKKATVTTQSSNNFGINIAGQIQVVFEVK